MSQASVAFLLFLLVVVLLDRLLPRLRWRNALLLAASYLFYATWDWRFCGLLALTTLVDDRVGRALVSSPRKRLWLALGLGYNLLVLVLFKYFDFFSTGLSQLLSAFGLAASPVLLHWAAPLGLSFYLLQSLAYKLEIAQGLAEPERDRLNLALFLAYFGQIVAGPIERGRNLLPQLRQRPHATAEQVSSGLHLLAFGLFKKVVIAQAAAQLIGAPVFSAPQTAASGRVLVGVYLFALQLYADFAGYSDLVRGFSRLLGIELTVNFRQPYFAGNIAEFWQRWHSSLSTWLRDYVFLPFSRAGLRRWRGQARRIQALSHVVTMLVSGLWHGANWTFLAWGLLHGVYLAAQRLISLAGWSPVAKLPPRLGRVVGAVLTFHAVLLGWVLFQATTLAVAADVYARMVSDLGARELRYLVARPLVLYLLLFGLDAIQARADDYALVRRLPLLLRTLVYVLLGLSLWAFWQEGAGAFIYAGF